MDNQVKTSRGTIIVDASSLLNLSCTIPDKFVAGGNQSQARYLNGLTFLAEQGFQVIIPEIVAVEAAGVLKTGVDLGKFLNLRYDSTKTLVPFLKDVAAGQYPNIAIAATGKPPEAQAFLSSLHRAVENHHERVKIKSGERKKSLRIKKSMINNSADLDTKGEISRIRREHYKAHLGYKAIQHLLDNKYTSPYESVFVLTDASLRNDLPQHIEGVTTQDLLAGLIVGKLAPAALGINADTDLAAFDRERADTSRNIAGNAHQPGFSNEELPPYIAAMEKKLFTLKLKSLAHELEKKQEEQPQNGRDHHDGPSRLSRFDEKFGKDWRAKLQSKNTKTNSRNKAG